MTRLSCAAPLLFVLALLPDLAGARIVDEGKLAQYCREEAIVKLGSNKAQIIMAPVEQKHGDFYANGQTDEANPTLFECHFDKHRAFVSIKVHAPHATGAGHGAASAAVDKCAGTMGPNARVEKVSDFGNGFTEVIMRDTGNGRRVACTAPTRGGDIQDWIELNN